MASEPRYKIRWPSEGHPNPETWPEDRVRLDAWLEDTATGGCVFVDGGAPEDQILCRDLKCLVDLLNEQAERIALFEQERIEHRRLLAYRDAQIEALRSDAKLVAEQFEAERIRMRSKS